VIPEDVHGYGAPVWSRFWAPDRAGRLAGPAAQAGTPAGKAVLRLSIRTDGEKITDARFQAYGCPVTVAVGQWLAEQLAGASRSRLSEIDAAGIRQSLEITADKAHCSLMGEDLVRALSRTLDPQP
jgi:NifU-like protein involved in Fe-S cluster formation